ncbi:MAG: penicillin-binding protein 1A [bacterium]
MKKINKFWYFLFIILFLVSSTSGFISGGLLRFRFLEDSMKDQLPAVRSLEDPASGVTRIYDRNNNLIAEFSTQWRDPIPLDSIPDNLINAIIAVEDRRFYEHQGISWFDIVRAFVKDLTSSGQISGASTITQQLARNRFLTFDKTMQRKLKEFFLAREIERNFSKDEILEMYLNEIYFGSGAYGVKAAARRYFGKSVSELNLSECALIAGIPRQHNYYNPIRNYQASVERRNLILKMMLDLGYINETEYVQAKNDSIVVQPHYLLSGIAPYFVEEVRRWLISHYGINRIYQSNGGLDVYTTVDIDVQLAAESLLEDGIQQVESNYNLKPLKDDKNAISEDGRTRYLQGALIATIPQSGEIIAMVGGRDFNESEFNRVTQSARQVGSSFKPFVYVAAIDNGFTLGDVMLDAPVVIDLGNGEKYKPINYDHKFEGFMTLRFALAKSRNTIAVKLARHIGISTVISYARLFGIKSQLDPVYSLALGSAGITPMEMVGAYQVFANGGIRIDPYMIERIEERRGNSSYTIYEHTSHPIRVISKTTAYLMQSIMSSVVSGGTASYAARLANLTRPAAAKTGTTDNYTDAWLVGYTPDLCCAVWVGFDSLRTIYRSATGGTVAGPIWAKFVVKASSILEIPPNSFPIPEGITSVRICKESGEIATPNCEEQYLEIFIQGTQPYEFCHIHGEFFDSEEQQEFIDDTVFTNIEF